MDGATYECLAVDRGGHICGDIGADESQQERVLAVKVEERGPMCFTLLYANTPPKHNGMDACLLNYFV